MNNSVQDGLVLGLPRIIEGELRLGLRNVVSLAQRRRLKLEPRSRPITPKPNRNHQSRARPTNDSSEIKLDLWNRDQAV